MEQRFGVTLTILIDEHITGTQLFAIEKGEFVQRAERPAADAPRQAVHVDDAGTMGEEEPEAEEEVSEETEEAAPVPAKAMRMAASAAASAAAAADGIAMAIAAAR